MQIFFSLSCLNTVSTRPVQEPCTPIILKSYYMNLTMILCFIKSVISKLIRCYTLGTPGFQKVCLTRKPNPCLAASRQSSVMFGTQIFFDLPLPQRSSQVILFSFFLIFCLTEQCVFQFLPDGKNPVNSDFRPSKLVRHMGLGLVLTWE